MHNALVFPCRGRRPRRPVLAAPRRPVLATSSTPRFGDVLDAPFWRRLDAPRCVCTKQFDCVFCSPILLPPSPVGATIGRPFVGAKFYSCGQTLFAPTGLVRTHRHPRCLKTNAPPVGRRVVSLFKPLYRRLVFLIGRHHTQGGEQGVWRHIRGQAKDSGKRRAARHTPFPARKAVLKKIRLG